VKGVFLDTETNGLNWSKHTILEIALRILDLSSGEEYACYSSFINIGEEAWKKSSIASLKFNGIEWKDIQEAPTKEKVKKELLQLFKTQDIKRGEAVFICQNPAFDRIFFSQLIEIEVQEKYSLPYNWLDLASMFWAKQIASHVAPHLIELSKDKIAKLYHIPPEAMPHKALNGVDHLIACYEKVVGFPSYLT
jgi:DNA polymerase-3 subunit epsilon/oligoribonuclease